MTRGPATRDREDGFTLVEVLVAFFIAALTLIMALRVLGEGAVWARRGPDLALRMDEAASVLDSALADPALEPGERAGVFADGHAWRLRAVDVTQRILPTARRRLLRVEIFDGDGAGAPLIATLSSGKAARQ